VLKSRFVQDSAPDAINDAREGRFVLLFVLTLSLHVAVPLLRDIALLHAVVSVALFVVVAYAGWISVWSPWLRVVYGVMLTVSVTSSVVTLVAASDATRIAWLACHAAVLTLVTVLVVRWTVRRERVTADTIFAALSAFYFMGFSWALVYALIDMLAPGSFSVGLGYSLHDAFYFSFVTLTTLGYGDILALAPLTRALVTTEALIGQIYLVVLVARLVSLRGA
jgi:hypothetical protein